MNTFKRYSFFIFLICITLFASSWGFLVHKTVHQLAVYQLPSDLREFYFKNMEYLVYNAPRPDTRRNTDSTEATKHFIDIERFDGSVDKLPLKWEDATKLYSKDSLLKYGYVPYQVMFMKDRLTNSFRNKNADSILFYSTDLGHYIADANVPLHTTENYDGQLTNQRGLHSLWESMIPEIEIGNYNLRSRHKAKYLNNPEQKIMDAAQRAYGLLDEMLAKEKEVSASFSDTQKYRIQMRRGKESKSYTTAFAKAYAASLKNTINDQLIHSADLIADFWYTCWVDGGKPDMESLMKTAFTADDKKAMKSELKSNKHNHLIQDNLLRSKKTESSSTAPTE